MAGETKWKLDWIKDTTDEEPPPEPEKPKSLLGKVLDRVVKGKAKGKGKA